jgi:PRTRC genetic system protein E
MMLIANLLPLLTRYSLAFNLIAGPDDTVTLTIIPHNLGGESHKLEHGEIRPIAITASAAEIDAELAKGAEGALGQLITARKSLAEQIAVQREAAEAARTASAEAAKAKAAAATPKPASSAGAAKTPTPAALPADAKSGEPASLW